MWSGAGKSETLTWEDESKIGFNFSQKEYEDAIYQQIKINKNKRHMGHIAHLRNQFKSIKL